MNLINSGPDHLRPAIFRSLLYEACGRIVNPIYGSVGLLWSGSWQLCQTAVESVLKGEPITQIESETAATNHGPPLKAYDIRHVSKDEKSALLNDLHKVKTRRRFKRCGTKNKKVSCYPDELNLSTTSHDSSLSHQSELVGESRETESTVQVGRKEASALNGAQRTSLGKVHDNQDESIEEGEIDLELTLGFESVLQTRKADSRGNREQTCRTFAGACKIELGVD